MENSMTMSQHKLKVKIQELTSNFIPHFCMNEIIHAGITLNPW